MNALVSVYFSDLDCSVLKWNWKMEPFWNVISVTILVLLLGTSKDTLLCILGRNHTTVMNAVLSVTGPACWRYICEHIQGKNPSAALSVSLLLIILEIWSHTCWGTLVRSDSIVISAITKLVEPIVWRCTCSTILEKQSLLIVVIVSSPPFGLKIWRDTCSSIVARKNLSAVASAVLQQHGHHR